MSNKARAILASLTVIITLLSASCSNIIEKREPTLESTTVIEETAVNTEAEDDTQATDVLAVPEFTNPLTGLEVSEELSLTRPVAVMINNISDAMPQEGTSYADIIYECIVEGAQTRLMAVYLDYKSAPVIGSVRSSREYYIDLAMNHDAIYVHAGGSDEAYRQIKASKINNLDGVNMYVPDMFYRDSQRRKTMAYEHTLMTTGEKIADGIEFKGYRSTSSDTFTQPFDFVDFGCEYLPENPDAGYVSLTYSKQHSPYYTYNEDTKKYERFQFGAEQKDNSTGDQLTFDNVIVLYCSTYNTGDAYGHYSVKVTGEGKGVYITRGGSVEITWKKSDRSTPVSLYTADGTPLMMNRGKTMVQVCTSSMEQTTVISEQMPE